MTKQVKLRLMSHVYNIHLFIVLADLIDFSLLIIYLFLFLFIKELTSAFDFPPLLVLLSSCCAQRTCTRSPVQHSCTVQYMFIYTLYEPGLRHNTPVQFSTCLFILYMNQVSGTTLLYSKVHVYTYFIWTRSPLQHFFTVQYMFINTSHEHSCTVHYMRT